MGKASKWLINFLLGKKEEKVHKKKLDIAFLGENVTPTTSSSSTTTPSSSTTSSTTTTNTIQPKTTPTMKRRWSFGRSNNKEKKSHKSSKSLDLLLITTNPILELQNHHHHNNNNNTNNNAFNKKVVDVPRNVIISKALADAAATRIQAGFRSYLAKKALCALRGLVKLQALVRGHLVRKQTTTTLRGMHALMAIQVRARFHRVLMADDNSHSISKIHGYTNHSQIERIERGGITTYFPEDLSSISKRLQQQHHQYEELVSFSNKKTPARASYSVQQPNYMAKTESSRAKTRSHSEPKQRPKSSRTSSVDETDDALTQRLSTPHLKRVVRGNQDPWFIKLYKSKRFLKESEIDADSDNTTSTSHFDYCNSLMAYEPHVNLY